MTNTHICPEDLVFIQMPASIIPDGATVRKVTGDYTYTLKHNITVYKDQQKGEQHKQPPLTIEGYFMVGAQGHINQVRPDKMLVWVVRAEDLVDTLKSSWDEESSQ